MTDRQCRETVFLLSAAPVSVASQEWDLKALLNVPAWGPVNNGEGWFLIRLIGWLVLRQGLTEPRLASNWLMQQGV